MTTRREFLQLGAGTLADIAFVGCDLLAATPVRAQARRREVVVNGRRAKTVDVHAHCAVPEALALMNLKLLAPGSSLPPVLEIATQASERMRAMDEQGIDVEALSINPYWYKADRDLAKQIIGIQNAKLAEPCAANHDRFVAFATVALQHPDLAAERLEEGVKKFGLRGAAIGGSVRALAQAPRRWASSPKSWTTMSCAGFGTGSGGPARPHSVGRATKALRYPVARAAIRSKLWQATMRISSGRYPSHLAQVRYASGRVL
jgi:Amidohydrolase